MQTDLQLLSRYRQRGDALAFRDLMQAHAGMVLATARRITRDAAMAEDVVQETFLQLARQSQQVTESVAAWLHRVAWRRACNAVRDDATRRRHEDAAVAEAETVQAPAVEASWREVEAVLDAVIDELPDNLRPPLVMHFLQGRSQREIAKELRLNQSTVSRAIDAGLTEVRSRLKSKGMLCGAGLGALIAAHSASAASVPAGLMLSLSKLGLSGIGGGSATASTLAAMSLATAIKLGLAALVLTTAGVVAVRSTSSASMPAVKPNIQVAAKEGAAVVPPLKENPAPAGMAPTVVESAAAALIPVAKATTAYIAPVHELVHSFPLPPRRPRGHMILDSAGWIWGTTASGGNYGLGTLYKMRTDGSEWQEMVSFNGISGVPRGTYPRGGVIQGVDGALWGTTTSGGVNNQGTLFRYDPRTGELETMVEFDGLGQVWAAPTMAPDGQLWGTTHYAVYRFNPANHALTVVFRGTGKTGAHPGTQFHAELVADGQGFFWGSSESGGAANWGVIFKVNIATGEATTVVEFTGKNGAFPGAVPIAAMTADKEGFLWGTTQMGGSADKGTVFKIHSGTGAIATVADFKARADDDPGAAPETQLIADGTGNFWGTTTTGGNKRYGTVYKLNAQSGALNSVVSFTGLEGELRGGPARGDLLSDGAGGLIGACDSGGAVGTIFRVDISTGKYTELTNVCDLAKSKEGHDVHGTPVAGAGDWLWGLAAGGAHHYGVIYKFNTVTNELVNVVDFTGIKGPCKGRYVDAGLVNDGQGYFWGTTISGGASDLGTIFKVQESTGTFTTVAEARYPSEGALAQKPSSQLVPDGKGFLWGATEWTIFKLNMSTSVVTTVAVFNSDKGPHHGSGGLGRLALDDKGFLWGCSQADNAHSRACLFKIDTSNDAFITLAELSSTHRDPAFWHSRKDAFWHSKADMYWDGKGFMWFTGVIDEGSRRTENSLFKVNTSTGLIEGRYRQPGFGMFGPPMMDEKGLLWGGTLEKGYMDNGSIYSFDTRTERFSKVLYFTGQGSQAFTGQQPQESGLMKHRDGNFYGITRVGGPGNGGTIYRLRYGPTPMTQEATMLADGRVVLHGTLTPNGFDTDAAFEWGTQPDLKQAVTLDAGRVSAGDSAKPVAAILNKLHPGTKYYFRLIGSNAANPVAQRGAVLSFIAPAAGIQAEDPSLLAARKADANTVAAGAASSRYALKINRVPGAGAGFVNGGLAGTAYELGKRYTLTAQADNDYIFDHWSGPGISGARAENRRLSFVFTDEFAKSPVITATFVRNPFRGESIGGFNGLVYAADGVTPDVGNTGAISLTVTRTGSFTGVLRYDGDIIPLAGVFDTGGLARIGPAGASPWALIRPGKPVLLVAMQLDLSAGGSHELVGTIGSADGATIAGRSVIAAARNYYYGGQHVVPAQYVTAPGGQALSIASGGKGDTHGLLCITLSGSTIFAAKLSDGTGVLAQAPLSQAHQAALFTQLYARRTGSVGGMVTLDALFKKEQSSDQPFWWGHADGTWLTVAVRRALNGEAQ